MASNIASPDYGTVSVDGLDTKELCPSTAREDPRRADLVIPYDDDDDDMLLGRRRPRRAKTILIDALGYLCFCAVLLFTSQMLFFAFFIMLPDSKFETSRSWLPWPTFVVGGMACLAFSVRVRIDCLDGQEPCLAMWENFLDTECLLLGIGVCMLIIEGMGTFAEWARNQS